MRKLGGISQKEDGSVVRDEIPVALLCSEFDRKPSGVSCAVVGTRLATDGRESNRDGALFAFGRENVNHGQLGNGVCAFEEAMSATAFGVDDTFGNSLAVEMSQEINQVEVLQEQRPILASPLSLVRMRHGHAIATDMLEGGFRGQGAYGDLPGGIDNILRSGLAVGFVGSELVLHVGSERCICRGSHTERFFDDGDGFLHKSLNRFHEYISSGQRDEWQTRYRQFIYQRNASKLR